MGQYELGLALAHASYVAVRRSAPSPRKSGCGSLSSGSGVSA